jgi:hypothetical protein
MANKQYAVASLTYTSRAKRTTGRTFLRRVSVHVQGCPRIPADGSSTTAGAWRLAAGNREAAQAAVAEGLSRGAEVMDRCRECGGLGI